ncbi:hypothetical protein J6590_030083 [Homalodisca vitripennis]|nr:hypothetical protein J6590_030083 [Homalodisca vitripennis]
MVRRWSAHPVNISSISRRSQGHGWGAGGDVITAPFTSISPITCRVKCDLPKALYWFKVDEDERRPPKPRTGQNSNLTRLSRPRGSDDVKKLLPN